jgi:hypothetical protein
MAMQQWQSSSALTTSVLFLIVAFLWSAQGVIVLRQPDHLYRKLDSFGNGTVKAAANAQSTETEGETKADKQSEQASTPETKEKPAEEEPHILVGNHSNLDSAGVGSHDENNTAAPSKATDKEQPSRQALQDSKEFDNDLINDGDEEDLNRDGNISAKEASQAVQDAEHALVDAEANAKAAKKHTDQAVEGHSAQRGEAKEAADELAAAEEQLQSFSARKAEQEAQVAEHRRELELAKKQDAEERAELAGAEADLRGAAKEVSRATGAVAERLEEKQEKQNQTKIAHAEHKVALQSYEQAVKEVEDAEAALAKAEKELKKAKGLESDRADHDGDHDGVQVLSCFSVAWSVVLCMTLSSSL